MKRRRARSDQVTDKVSCNMKYSHFDLIPLNIFPESILFNKKGMGGHDYLNVLFWDRLTVLFPSS